MLFDVDAAQNCVTTAVKYKFGNVNQIVLSEY